MTTVSQLGIFSVIATVLHVTSVKVFFKTDLGNSLLLTVFSISPLLCIKAVPQSASAQSLQAPDFCSPSVK